MDNINSKNLDSDCIFCKIIKGELPADKIKETDDVLVFMSLEGHPMVIPKKHIENIFGLDDRSASEIMKEAVKLANAVKQSLDCEGVNLVQSNGAVAGQDVFHFHLHIKPRWPGDDVSLVWNTDTVDADIRKKTAETIRNCIL